MPDLIVETRDGSRHTISGASGRSLMEAIRAAGIEELAAICGGNCSCGTCHVYVDHAFAALAAPIGEDEDDLLSFSDHRRDGSRLACQIPVRDDLAGMKVKIAPES